MCIFTLNVEEKTNAGLLSDDPLDIRKKCVMHYIGTELALLAHKIIVIMILDYHSQIS